MKIVRLLQIVIGVWILVVSAAPVAAESSWEYWSKRKHSGFLAVGFGSTNVMPANDERQVEGISFEFATQETGLGGAGMLGYWITDNVGIEVGYWDFGVVHVPFNFEDPHDNSKGTGESTMHFTGPGASLLLGYDIGAFQVFGRIGALSWSQDMSTRFDVPGEPAIRRSLSYAGTGLTYGAGLGWRFHSSWSIQLQYERGYFDEDKIDMFSLGVSVDFLPLLLR